VNPRKGKGLTALKKSLAQTAKFHYTAPVVDFVDNKAFAPGDRSCSICISATQ
jgi:hypothetical protein